MLYRSSTIAVVGALVLLAGCARKEESAAPEPEPMAEVEEMEVEVAPPVAVAQLMPKIGMDVTGTVTFTETDAGVEVVADVARVEPGPHGLHLHEIGDCTAEDFTSAGGHFNPTDAPHGAPTDLERHAGDFGNIEIGEDGTGQLKLVTDMLTVADGPDTVVGRAVILHESADDLVSQPTGAAGGRIACGVVMLEGGEMMEMVEEMPVGEEGEGD